MNKLMILFSMIFFLQENNIEFTGIKKEYQQNSIINFEIKNNSSDLLYYTITMEANINSQWKEISYNIDNPISKATRWYKTNSNSSQNISLDLKKVKKYIPFKFEEYRFSVKYYSKDKYNEGKLVRAIFLIK